MDKMLQFNGLVMDVRPTACFINVDGVTGWVPDSQADYIDEPKEGKDIDFKIPEWLAISKGFIEDA